MDHEIKESPFLHLSNVGRNSDHVFSTSCKLAVFFQQILKQILHIVKSADDPFLHRKHNLYISRGFFIHFICFITDSKNCFLIGDCNDILFLPYGVLFFIINFDLISSKINTVNISCHLLYSFHSYAFPKYPSRARLT